MTSIARMKTIICKAVGAFAKVLQEDRGPSAAQSSAPVQTASGEDFLGFHVNLPFGIPAGPLLNERFTTAAFRMGFDLAVYKTVRSRAWGCNAFPNVLAVHPKKCRRIADSRQRRAG